MTLTEATKELKWIRTLLMELGYNGKTAPTDLYVLRQPERYRSC